MKNKTIAIIPAREGSKRLPGKNKKLLHGKPLIEYTIECAISCYFFDEIIVATDDKDILDMCKERFKGYITLHTLPSKYTQDDSKPEDVAIYVLKEYPHDTIVVWLQPTSPLRSKEDIIACYEVYKRIQKPLATCVLIKPKQFRFNGAIYIISLDKIRKDIYIEGSVEWLYIMPQERSVDVDTLEDFLEVKRLLEKR